MVTYNLIVDFVKNFTDNHAQLNTFYSGKLWNFQSKVNLYPSLVMLPVSSNVAKGEAFVTFNIVIADILNKDRSNVDEIYSDTLQIAQDLFATLNNSDEDFFIADSGFTLDPFEEAFDDVLAGWIATITIKFPFSGNICVLPIRTTSSATLSVDEVVVDCINTVGWTIDLSGSVVNGSGTYNVAISSDGVSWQNVDRIVGGNTTGSLSWNAATPQLPGDPPLNTFIRLQDFNDNLIISNSYPLTFDVCQFNVLENISIDCTGTDHMLDMTGVVAEQSGNFEILWSTDDIGFTTTGLTFSADISAGSWSVNDINLNDSPFFNPDNYVGQTVYIQVQDTGTGDISNSSSYTVPDCTNNSSLVFDSITSDEYLTFTASNVYEAGSEWNPGETLNLLMEYSTDNNSWSPMADRQVLPSSPFTGTASDTYWQSVNFTDTYYYRLIAKNSIGDLIYSNSLQYFTPSTIVLNYIDVFYTFFNATATDIYTPLQIQESVDGNTWNSLGGWTLATPGGASPWTGTDSLSWAGGSFPGVTNGYFYRIIGYDQDLLPVYSNPVQYVYPSSATLNSLCSSGDDIVLNFSFDTLFERRFICMANNILIAYSTDIAGPWNTGTCFNVTSSPSSGNVVNTFAGVGPGLDGYYFRIIGEDVNGDAVESNIIQFNRTVVILESVTASAFAIQYINAYEYTPGLLNVSVEVSNDGIIWTPNATFSIPSSPYTGTIIQPASPAYGTYWRVAMTNSCNNTVYSNEYYLDYPSSVILNDIVFSIDINGPLLDYDANATNLYEYSNGNLDVMTQFSLDGNDPWSSRYNVTGVLATNPDNSNIVFNLNDAQYIVGRWIRIFGVDYHENDVYSNSLQILPVLPVLSKTIPGCFANQQEIIVGGSDSSFFTDETYEVQWSPTGMNTWTTLGTVVSVTSVIPDTQFSVGVGNAQAGNTLDFRYQHQTISEIVSNIVTVVMLPAC